MIIINTFQKCGVCFRIRFYAPAVQCQLFSTEAVLLMAACVLHHVGCGGHRGVLKVSNRLFPYVGLHYG